MKRYFTFITFNISKHFKPKNQSSKIEKCNTGRKSAKKCHLLFEWPPSTDTCTFICSYKHIRINTFAYTLIHTRTLALIHTHSCNYTHTHTLALLHPDIHYQPSKRKKRANVGWRNFQNPQRALSRICVKKSNALIL